MRMSFVQRLQAMRATHWLWREVINRRTGEVTLLPLWRRVPAGCEVMSIRW